MRFVNKTSGGEAISMAQTDQTSSQVAAAGTTSEEAQQILDRLASRFSCRDFDHSPMDPDLLAAIVADGVQAPSSCNQQNWHFIIVTQPEAKRRATEIAGGNPHFETCSALIYLCFQKGWTHGNFSIVQSVAAAGYHMMLSAHLRGYACIWNAGIGDHAALHAMLDLPPTFEIQGALAIGTPRPTAPEMKAPRRPLEEVMSFGTFSRPDHAVYPAKPAKAYPYFEIGNASNPYAEWDPTRWTWGQIADFRGYSVWAKSPLAGVYISRRQGDAQAVEHSLLPPTAHDVVEVMPWGGTSTVALDAALSVDAHLHVAELAQPNLDFIRERLKQEGVVRKALSFDLMAGGKLPYADQSMDLFVLPQVLEHVPDPKALLDDVHRILRPGGHVVLSSRNMSSAYGAHWRDVESVGQVPNQGPFTPIEAATLRDLVKARFEIEATCGIGREATGDAERLDGNDAETGRLFALRARRT